MQMWAPNNLLHHCSHLLTRQSRSGFCFPILQPLWSYTLLSLFQFLSLIEVNRRDILRFPRPGTEELVIFPFWKPVALQICMQIHSNHKNSIVQRSESKVFNHMVHFLYHMLIITLYYLKITHISYFTVSMGQDSGYDFVRYTVTQVFSKAEQSTVEVSTPKLTSGCWQEETRHRPSDFGFLVDVNRKTSGLSCFRASFSLLCGERS